MDQSRQTLNRRLCRFSSRHTLNICWTAFFVVPLLNVYSSFFMHCVGHYLHEGMVMWCIVDIGEEKRKTSSRQTHRNNEDEEKRAKENEREVHYRLDSVFFLFSFSFESLWILDEKEEEERRKCMLLIRWMHASDRLDLLFSFSYLFNNALISSLFFQEMIIVFVLLLVEICLRANQWNTSVRYHQSNRTEKKRCWR